MKYLDLVDNLYPDWHHAAACHPDRGHDPALWFPTADANGLRDRRTRTEITEPARRICRDCPVRRKCLDDAIGRRETSGVWGGKDFQTTPKASSTTCGTQGGYLRHLRRGTEPCTDCRAAHEEFDEHKRQQGGAA